MDTLQPQIDTIPLHEARFLDQLDPEIEEFWQELLTTARETEQTNESLMVAIWQNDEIPQALQDRAMLVAMRSKPIQEHFGIKSLRTSMGFQARLDQLQNPAIVPSFDTDRFADWFLDGLDYQDSKQRGIFTGTQMKDWSLDLLAEGLIDDDKVDDIFNRLYMSTQFVGDPVYTGTGEVRLTPAAEVLYEIFYPPDYGMFGGQREPSIFEQAWAYEKIMTWFMHKIDPTEERIPAWLKGIPHDSMRGICSALTHEIRGTDSETWSHFLPVFEMMGWESVLRGDFITQYQCLAKMTDKNKAARTGLLWHLYNTRKDTHMYTSMFTLPEHVDTAELVAQESGDQELIDAIAEQKQKYIINKRAYDERSQAQSAEFAEKRAKSPEVIAQAAAKEKLGELLVRASQW